MTQQVPPGYRSRNLDRADAAALADLINACNVAVDDPTRLDDGEVLDDWHGADLENEAIAIVDESNCLVGCIEIDNRMNVVVSNYGYVHPDHTGHGLGSWLVDWGETWACDRLDDAPPELRVVVQHYVDAENMEANHLFTSRGFEVVRQTWIMAIDLDHAIAPADWPAGFTARSFVPGQDEHAYHEAIEDAFRDLWGRPPGTFERFMTLIGSPVFDPELWMLAEKDGEIVGVASGRIVSGAGWIDIVGVGRAWRRHGIGLALLREALSAFQAKGVDRVELSVDAESGTGAPRLYQRAGMAVRRRYLRYRKEIRPGKDFVEPDRNAGQ